MFRSVTKKFRSAFTLIEAVFVVAIFASLSVGFIYFVKKNRETRNVEQEVNRAIVFEKAIRNNFNEIVDTFSVATTRSTTSVGWRYASSTRVFPLFSSGNLTYNIDFSLLTPLEKQTLSNTIADNLKNVCRLSSSNSSSLVFICPYLKSFTVANNQLSDGSIDPSLPPTINFTLKKRSSIGYVTSTSYTNTAYKFDLNDTFAMRRKINIDKLSGIKNKLRSFYNVKLTQEIANAFPKGLNSDDDSYVPWQWLLAASGVNFSSLMHTECDLPNNSGYCFSSSIWLSGTYGVSFITKRFIDNILNGDFRYRVDAFGNMIFIHPFYNQCPKGGDILSCTVFAPLCQWITTQHQETRRRRLPVLFLLIHQDLG